MKKGFTLIELLLVVAIIGILSTIILVSLNIARNKAKDANIKAHLDQARRVAELYYSNNSFSYDLGDPNKLTSSNPADMLTLSTAISSLGSSMVVVSADQAFCASAVLITDSSQAWCIDSSGQSKAVSADGCDGATVCPSN